MLFRKNKLDKLSKNISAHDRAHDLHALMSGAFFDPLMSGAFFDPLMSGAFFDALMSGSKNERAHVSALMK
jgi:hypothetical protein